MSTPSTQSPENICAPDSQNLPAISVIIVSWNASRFLEECLDSLSRGIATPYEVIVVDNASSDGSPEMVATKFPWVQLIQTGANLGFSKGNNVGIRKSRGKYLALVNSDVNVFPGCLDKLAHFLDANPDTGLVGPRIMSGDRSQQYSCRHFPSLWNNFCDAIHLNKVFPRSRFFTSEEMSYFSYDKTTEVEVLSGCFILARRGAVDQFGLLDEAFFFYAEDLDWSHRCALSGWKVMFHPDAESIHYGGGSSSNDHMRFSATQLKARLQLWAKYYSIFALWGLVCVIILHCCTRLIRAGLAFIFRFRGTKDPKRLAHTQIACLKSLMQNLPFRPASKAR